MLTNHGAAISQQIYRSTLTARADAGYAVLIEYEKNGKAGDFDVDVEASSESAAFAKARAMLKKKVGEYKMTSESIQRMDSRKDTLIPPNPELQSAMALGGSLAVETTAAAVDTMVEQLNSLGKEAEALVERATRADARGVYSDMDMNHPEVKKFDKARDRLMEMDKKYNVNFALYQQGKMKYSEWDKFNTDYKAEQAKFEEISKAFRAWRRQTYGAR